MKSFLPILFVSGIFCKRREVLCWEKLPTRWVTELNNKHVVGHLPAKTVFVSQFPLKESQSQIRSQGTFESSIIENMKKLFPSMHGVIGKAFEIKLGQWSDMLFQHKAVIFTCPCKYTVYVNVLLRYCCIM